MEDNHADESALDDEFVPSFQLFCATIPIALRLVYFNALHITVHLTGHYNTMSGAYFYSSALFMVRTRVAHVGEGETRNLKVVDLNPSGWCKNETNL